MLNYNLDSLKSAEKLIWLCNRYKEEMDIDITYGRQIVDGCSLLGVTSLIGHFVTIVPNSEDKGILEKFSEELEEIKCWRT